MSEIKERDGISALGSLKGRTLIVVCATRLYKGILEDVRPTYIKLTHVRITDNMTGWLCGQTITSAVTRNDWCINRAAIESYAALD